MADETQTRLYNRTTQPRVVAWGDGVVMSGESFLTDSPEGYQPDHPNSPWTTDPKAAEALSALLSRRAMRAGDASDSVTEGDTRAQGDPQGAQDSQRATVSSIAGSGFYPNLPLGHSIQPEGLVVRASGDVVNKAGEVVGRIESAASGRTPKPNHPDTPDTGGSI